LGSAAASRIIATACTQAITYTALERPDHYMKTPELELPKHVYDESTAPDGSGTRLTYSAERLVAWAERERGDAIGKWCRQICDRTLENIDAWEDNRILQLEDEWVSIEQDIEDDEDDENEHHYHQACDTVVREAASKRDRARQQMLEHSAAIEKLVREARNHIEAHRPPPQEEHFVGYFLAIAAIAAVAYVVVT
jgi:hypothetical protein